MKEEIENYLYCRRRGLSGNGAISQEVEEEENQVIISIDFNLLTGMEIEIQQLTLDINDLTPGSYFLRTRLLLLLRLLKFLVFLSK